MTRRAVVTLAAIALGAGVFVSGANGAPPTDCSGKLCSDDVSTACAGLSGQALKTCKTCVLDECKTAACSCAGTPSSCADTGPICNPPPTTTTSTSSTSTSSTSITTTTSTTTSTATTPPSVCCIQGQCSILT